MKTTKISLKRKVLLNILYPACILATMVACDSLESDSTPKAPSGANTSQIYVQSNGTAVIDLSSIVASGKPSTVAITSSTTQGSLTELGAGILQYKPSSSASARDGFEITVTSEDNVVTKDSVVIIIEEDSVNLPCGIYPKEDIIFGTEQDETIEIDVLSNDYICGYALSELEVSIQSADSFPPYYGSASVVGNKIIYTSGKSFTTADKIVYKISVKDNPSIVAYGLVYLISQPACDFTLSADSVISNEEFTQIKISGLTNDDLCDTVNNFQITISAAPANGIAYVESGEFVYTPNNLATDGFTDEFEYKVCIDGTCKTAQVTVTVNTQ